MSGLYFFSHSIPRTMLYPAISAITSFSADFLTAPCVSVIFNSGLTMCEVCRQFLLIVQTVRAVALLTGSILYSLVQNSVMKFLVAPVSTKTSSVTTPPARFCTSTGKTTYLFVSSSQLARINTMLRQPDLLPLGSPSSLFWRSSTTSACGLSYHNCDKIAALTS